MNNPVFISIEGSTQGLLTAGAFTPESVGNIYQNGHEDETLVKAFTHAVKIPRDAGSGQPTGRRTHDPMTISKLIDKSSPLLFNALTTGETLTKVEIKWYRPGFAGKQEHFYTMELEDAVIVNIETSMGTEAGLISPIEKVSLSYRKITWRHEIASTSGEDDWRIGVGA